jgi:acetyltransferase-like isoleucine patch superfamily enzyme
MSLKSRLKRYLLKTNKGILVDKNSDLNYDVINQRMHHEYPCQIANSKCNLTFVSEGVIVSDAYTFGDVSLGRFATITGPGTVIKSLKERISIGSFTSVGQNVCIVDFNHNFDRITSCFINHLIFNDNFKTDLGIVGPVTIGEDVWIGSNVVILPGITIGRGSVIGAGSVVTKDIPSYSIVVGNPAKVVSQRFDADKIDFLEKLRWWEWDIEKIKRNKDVFELNMKVILSCELHGIIRDIKN